MVTTLNFEHINFLLPVICSLLSIHGPLHRLKTNDRLLIASGVLDRVRIKKLILKMLK